MNQPIIYIKMRDGRIITTGHIDMMIDTCDFIDLETNSQTLIEIKYIWSISLYKPEEGISS